MVFDSINNVPSPAIGSARVIAYTSSIDLYATPECSDCMLEKSCSIKRLA